MIDRPDLATAQRRIRSFVRREGRMTDAQRAALETLWPRYGIEVGAERLNVRVLFGRDAPVHLEIGFGMGHSLAHMAAAHPELNYLGIEVYRPGIGHLLRALDAGSISNVRVIRADAVEVLEHDIPADSLAAVNLFFPDPWPKKRHHKRRIVQPAWVELVRTRLVSGGCLHMATDWEAYAEQMHAVMSTAAGFRNCGTAAGYAPRPDCRPETRFERRGLRRGHGVWDLIYQKV